VLCAALEALCEGIIGGWAPRVVCKLSLKRGAIKR